ncbi:TetR/AcrR family transcriptional regulator [Lysobacter sp. S4-A87]|uniref:TetR/AcrR family transcriptional regulator n=1 Tax=Lysobacter sp. S4-A87 TaxID=2925843 RepID=UPI001F538197|nr:TetR/AcrR family transcriptional regulator [Lysobacter sp. S4-A87]UNK49803.1 TetR/AcrR family transcriptional regulator [Lysobacter sp. S4-A87]
MARPRSEDKRNALLAAAIEVFAEDGINAPTARIAKVAGVAEGTLFTYFSNKDELLNHLYLEIKRELREAMLSTYPRAADIKQRARHVWRTYVDWGLVNVDKRKVVAQLVVSDRITEDTRTVASAGFADFHSMLQESMAKGQLREHPPTYTGAILVALAETTMDFMLKEPDAAEQYRTAGFEAFWRAVASG